MVAYSKGMPIGTRAPDFSLTGTDGHTYSLASFADKKIVVVLFTCNHCPYAQATEGRFIQLQNDYAAKGVQLVAISSNDAQAYPDDSFDNMVARAKEKHYSFPYLYDSAQTVARAYEAACTPDIFVFDEKRTLRYNGRLDDNWKDASQVKRHELREVIDGVLLQKAWNFDTQPSMGCSIKWKR